MQNLSYSPSTFDLSVSEQTAFEFFAVFSRFEYALKRSGYIRANTRPIAPAWRRFGQDMNSVTYPPGAKLEAAVNYLCGQPPAVHIDANTWAAQPLVGASNMECAIDAVVRVRNNLFHGDKHFGPHAQARDQKLVDASLLVLYACLDNSTAVREAYTGV